MADLHPKLHEMIARIDSATAENGGVKPEYFELSSKEYREFLEVMPPIMRITRESDRCNLLWHGVAVTARFEDV